MRPGRLDAPARRCIVGLALLFQVALAQVPPAAPPAPGASAASAAPGAASARPITAPSTLPQVRVVQEMHTARIDQIRADARFDVLLTISSDKTLRVWRTSDLRLVRSIMLPSEPGPEGTPYAVAITPDGRRAFVGGYTGWQWHRASRIYTIDLGTGLITGTLGRFTDDVVTSMDLSPDGRRLAVGLGRGGLVVLDTANGAALQADREYGAPVTFVHHGPDGRLATASADGCLRVYGASGQLTYRNQYPLRPANERQCVGGELGGVRFSPDGRWLALGMRYLRQGDRWQPEVAVFDAQTMTLKRALRSDDADQRSLCCVAWSPDSRELFVNGTAEGDRPTPLFRVRGPERGPLERWEVGRQQFTNMLPLPDGTLIFATSAPSLAKLQVDGQVAIEVLPGNVDFHATREKPEAFLVSGDGRSVAFDRGGGRWLEVRPFDADAAAVLREAAAAPTGYYRAALRTGAVKVAADTGLFSHRQPVTVNGSSVALGFEEGVRSWAVHATRPVAALGTQHGVRLVDAQGRPMPGWEQPRVMPAPVWHTVITDDGRFVVVAVGDGTVRWLDTETGQERLGLFVHANAVDWVAWRPDGYYASSPGGDQFIGWLVNRGDAASPDFFRAVQFERTLYRPEWVRRSLAADEGRKATSQALAGTLAGLAAPRVRIEALVEATREVRFSVEATGRAVREVGVYAEGLPVLATAQRAVPPGQGRVTRTVVIPPGLPLDRVRVEAESDSGLGMDEVAALKPSRATAGRGRLWVLAVGVRQFDAFAACGTTRRCAMDVPELPNAPNDAATLIQRLRERLGDMFSEVRVRLLAHQVGTAPTKAAVMQALRELEGAGPEDTVLVFIASHGVAAGPEGSEFYVLPADVQVSALERVLAEAEGRTPPPNSSAASLLSGTELSGALRRLAGRRIVALDTCHSGAAGVSRNPYMIAKRSVSAQVAVVTSASGSELAHEHSDPRVRHGAFTEALLRALDGHADADADGVVTLEEAFRFVVPEVQRNVDRVNAAALKRDRGHKPFTQTPALYANPVLSGSTLSRAGPPSPRPPQTN